MNLDDPVDVNNDMFKDLIDLATTDKIYLGETSDGGLMFRDGLSRYNKKIAAKCVVALGLTEVCCEIGKGKIFYVSMVEDLSGPVVNELTGNAKKKAIYTFFRLPKLIYVPFIWTEEDRQIWKAMTHAGREFLILIHQQGNPKAKSALADIHNHVDRLLLLNARSGAVPLMQEVLPLDLIFDPEEKRAIRLNRYNEEHAGCKALLAIMPQAYIGWCHRMQQNYIRIEYRGRELADRRGAWFLTNKRKLRPYAAANASILANRLWDMFLAEEPRSLMKLRHFLQELIKWEAALPRRLPREKG